MSFKDGSSSLNCTNVSSRSNGSETSQGCGGATTDSHGETYSIITTALFSFIFVTGVIGNSISIASVTRRRHMRTSCNYFITNIALADLGVALIAAPLRIVETFTSWPLGKELCNFLWPLQDVCVCVSVVTHTMIALERHRAIVSPFKPRYSLRKTKLVALGIWLGCYITSGLPIAFNLGLKEEMAGKIYCTVMWPSLLFRQAYIMYLVALFICAPLIVQMFAYVRIMRALRRKSLLDSPRASSHRKLRQERRARLVKTLVTILVVFQVCYLPRGALLMLNEFGSSYIQSRVSVMAVLPYVDLLTLVLYYCKHVINPLILFGMSAEFRDVFVSLLKCESDSGMTRRKTLAGSLRNTAV